MEEEEILGKNISSKTITYGFVLIQNKSHFIQTRSADGIILGSFGHPNLQNNT